MIGKNEVLQRGSRKRYWVPVFAPSGVNLSGLTVEMSFREPSTPDAEVEWHPATWFEVDGRQCASVIVSNGAPDPSAVSLTPGDYEVSWRVLGADPEQPAEVAPNRLILR